MATTYLTLTNRVLRELNETELTSSTFSSSRGIQTAVKDIINKGIHDIYNETGEIPLLYARTTQDLTVGDNEYSFPTDFRKADMDSFTMGPKEIVTNGEFTSNINSWTTGDGSPSYTSSGIGRLNLNSSAAYQANNTILNTTFTATAQVSYIYLEASGVQLDVDYVRISRNDIAQRKLAFVSYDSYLQTYKATDDTNKDSDGNNWAATSYGSQVVDTSDLSSFTAFADLKASDVQGWVEAALGADEVTAMKAALDAQIAESITPTSVTKTIS